MVSFLPAFNRFGERDMDANVSHAPVWPMDANVSHAPVWPMDANVSHAFIE